MFVCQLRIETVTEEEFMYLGTAFFLRYYTIFDIDRRQIGIAKNNDNTTLEEVLAASWV